MTEWKTGQIRIKVCKDPEYRLRLAQYIALDLAHTPKTGWHYVKPHTGEIFYIPGVFIPVSTNPELHIPVKDFVDGSPNDFTAKEWQSAIGPDAYIEIMNAWVEEFGIEELPEQFLDEVLDWALDHPRFTDRVKAGDDYLHQKLVPRIIPLIKDELIIG